MDGMRVVAGCDSWDVIAAESAAAAEGCGVCREGVLAGAEVGTTAGAVSSLCVSGLLTWHGMM